MVIFMWPSGHGVKSQSASYTNKTKTDQYQFFAC